MSDTPRNKPNVGSIGHVEFGHDRLVAAMAQHIDGVITSVAMEALNRPEREAPPITLTFPVNYISFTTTIKRD
jgi:translation elongation factor EF-Tu-like GTPase